jgi:hypothetical protein
MKGGTLRCSQSGPLEMRGSAQFSGKGEPLELLGRDVATRAYRQLRRRQGIEAAS